MPPANPIRAAFPSGPLLDLKTGNIHTAWRGFFMSLYARTGDAAGVSTAGLQVEFDAEIADRTAADMALAVQLRSEAAARQTGDAGEAAARQNADATKVAKAGDTMTGELIGTTGSFLIVQTGGTSGPVWYAGTGAPTAVLPVGSLYSDTAGAAGARLYVSAGGGAWTGIPGV